MLQNGIAEIVFQVPSLLLQLIPRHCNKHFPTPATNNAKQEQVTHNKTLPYTREKDRMRNSTRGCSFQLQSHISQCIPTLSIFENNRGYNRNNTVKIAVHKDWTLDMMRQKRDVENRGLTYFQLSLPLRFGKIKPMQQLCNSRLKYN